MISSTDQRTTRAFQFRLSHLLLAVLIAAVFLGVVRWWPTGSKVLVLKYGGPDNRFRAAAALGDMGSNAAGAVGALIETFADPNLRVRGAASDALIQLGPDVRPSLIAAVDDDRSAVRAMVIRTLGQMRAETDEFIFSAMEDEAPAVRYEAVRVLMSRRPVTDRAVRAFIERVRDPDAGIRRSAAHALRFQQDSSREASRALIEALEDPSNDVRAAAILSLGAIGVDQAILPLLFASLGDEAATVRGAASQVLLSRRPSVAEVSGPAGVAALIELMQHDQSEVRASAVRVLARVGPNAAEAVPALIAALGDDDDSVRSSAVWTIGSIGPAARSAVPALIQALENGDREIPYGVIDALGQIGPSAKPAVPALVAVIEGSAPSLVLRAVRALIKIDPDTEALDGGLRGVLRFEADSMRGRAASILAEACRVDPERFVPVLSDGLRGGGLGTRRTATIALRRIGSDARLAAEALLGALEDDDQHVRWDAALALTNAGSTRAQIIPVLMEAMREGELPLRYKAIGALGRMGPAVEFALSELLALQKQLDPNGTITPQPPPVGKRPVPPRNKAQMLWVVQQAIEKIDPGEPVDERLE